MRSLSALVHQPQSVVLCTCPAHIHDLGPAGGRRCQIHSPRRRRSAANLREVMTDGLSCQTWRMLPSRSLCRSMTMSEQQSVSDLGGTHWPQTRTQRSLLRRNAGGAWKLIRQIGTKVNNERVQSVLENVSTHTPAPARDDPVRALRTRARISDDHSPRRPPRESLRTCRQEAPLQPLLGHAAVEIVPQGLPLIPILPAAPEQVPTRD